ncbi:hypothetical protein PYCCODRAFT_349736 [Trametes coccinea BRFM310]|uniref:Uncharacterized protein n=1 Tax=Trametes coccinea (strain BRFM310) TaxID=1353009 RepID=A0A1Y2J2X8_TRAC3|nr:hypothetical protein PYCCODRAFT_349736 [Trametes coccinea BRFM310]
MHLPRGSKRICRFVSSVPGPFIRRRTGRIICCRGRPRRSEERQTPAHATNYSSCLSWTTPLLSTAYYYLSQSYST